MSWRTGAKLTRHFVPGSSTGPDTAAYPSGADPVEYQKSYEGYGSIDGWGTERERRLVKGVICTH